MPTPEQWDLEATPKGRQPDKANRHGASKQPQGGDGKGRHSGRTEN